MGIVGKVFEVMYIVIAVFFTYEAIVGWNTQRDNAYVFLIMAALAVFMFFFRRKTRIKREEYFRNKK